MSIDDVRNYWDARPCNVRHSAAPVGSIEYSRQVTERKYLVEPHIPLFANFRQWDGARVLEIGCGIGTDSIEFAKAGAYVTAIDLSIESLAIARQRAYAERVNTRISFRPVNVEWLSRWLDTNHHYDLVYSFGALHHTPNPKQAFAEVAKFAGPDTVIKLMLYNKVSTKALALTHGRLWRDDLIAQQSEAQSGCPVTHSYTPWGARKLLSRWFDVKSVRVDHIFPYKVEDYVNYKYTKHWWAELPGFRIAERTLGWHLLIDAQGRA